MEQSALCLSPFPLSLSLKTLPFSLSNGTTQISSDASCDIAHLWWHGLLASLVQYNILVSYKEQSSITSNATEKIFGLLLSEEKKNLNVANIQTSVIYWYKRRLFKATIKDWNYVFIITELFKPCSLIAQSRARRQTQTKEDLKEQNQHKKQAHVSNKDSKVCLPFPCPPLKRDLHLTAFLLWRDLLQEEKRGVSKTWVTMFTKTTFNPITASPCFYFLFHGIKIKWNIIKNKINLWLNNILFYFQRGKIYKGNN